jgi:hypothetical protein
MDVQRTQHTSTAGAVRRPQVGEVGEQIAVGTDAIPCHLPVCENPQEGIDRVVGERAAIARE